MPGFGSSLIKTLNTKGKEVKNMEAMILNMQNITAEDDILDEVDGARFSTFSGGGCGNWSALSFVNC